MFIVIALFVATNMTFAQEIEVTVAQGLESAITYANEGNANVLVLADDGGIYPIPAVEINVPLTIKAKDGLAAMPEIHPNAALETNDWIKINNDLTLQGVVVDGQIANSAEYAQIKYMLKIPATQDEGSPEAEPDLIVKDCVLQNMYKTGDPATSVDGSIWDVSKGGFCGIVSFENCMIKNIGDEAMRAINGHKSDHIVSSPMGGHFNELTVKNCTFVNVNGSSIKLQGDADTTNASPPVMFENLTFYNCGGQVIWSRAIDGVQVKNLIISTAMVGGTEDSYRGGRILYVEGLGSYVSHIDTVNMKRIVGTDTVEIADKAFVAGGGSNVPGTKYGTIDMASIYGYDPMFADAANGDFTLAEGSPVLSLADDGGALGDRNWAVNAPRVIQVTVAQGLESAITYANGGNADVLELVDAGGVYAIGTVEINVPLTIKGVNDGMPEIHPNAALETNDWIKINNDLYLDGVVVDGQIANSAEYAQIKYMLKVPATQDEGSPNPAPNLVVTNSTLRNMYTTGDPATSVDGSIWDVSKGGFCGVVRFEDCTIENTGDEAMRAINGHKSDHIVSSKIGGHFNALTVRNCTFNYINGSSIKLQGDADTTNASPGVLFENLTFYNCGGQVIWSRAIDGVICRNHIVSHAKFKGAEDSYRAGRIMYIEGNGSYIANVDTFMMARIVGTDTVEIADEPFVVGGSTNVPGTKDGMLYEETIYGLDPLFADAENGDFTLADTSPVLTLAHDGGALGDLNWAPTIPSAVENNEIVIPESFRVSQNYPNPFNPVTTIQFTLNQTDRVNITIYNVLGGVIETLVNRQLQAGNHTITWNASNYTTGVYFYNVKAGEFSITKKMILLR